MSKVVFCKDHNLIEYDCYFFDGVDKCNLFQIRSPIGFIGADVHFINRYTDCTYFVSKQCVKEYKQEKENKIKKSEIKAIVTENCSLMRGVRKKQKNDKKP